MLTIATGRHPTWARPLALFTSCCDFGAPPEIVRLPWARSWRPLFGAYFAGFTARRILRFQPPSFVPAIPALIKL
jgi:hypothetical protein